MAIRGKPFQSGNKFGRGRPPGSRNKTTEVAQALMDSHAEPVVRKALVMALQGESAILRAVLDRIAPVRRETPVSLSRRLSTTTLTDLSRASEQVVAMSTSGKITITAANGLVDLIEKRRKLIETEELEQRIRALESKH